MLVCVCVLHEGRIQLSVSYLRSHNRRVKPQLCGTPLDPRATGFQFAVAAEPLSLSPLCLPASLTLSLFFSVSKNSYINRQQACRKQQICVEADTDSQMQSETGSDFSEEALHSCSMTGSHENVSATLLAHVISSKAVNCKKAQSHNQYKRYVGNTCSIHCKYVNSLTCGLFCLKWRLLIV